MMMPTPCDIYACRQPALPEKTVTTVVDNEITVIEVCEEHFAFFEAFHDGDFAIGRTFTGEIEVRPIPKQPATPAPLPE